MSFPDRFKIAMGRSFFISLVTKSRIGASQILSRRLCGSGAVIVIPSGQSRCYFTQIDAGTASCATSRSGLKAAHYIRQADGMHARISPVKRGEYRQPGCDRWAALNFEISKHTLQLRGGSGVDAPRPPFWERRCGGI